MFSVIVCRFAIKFIEKRRIYEWFALLNVFLGSMMFCSSFSNSTFVMYVITMILIGVVLFTQSSLKYLFIRDVAVCDTFQTGFRREGIYQLAVQVSEGIMATVCQAVPQILLPYMGWREITNRIASDDIIDRHYISTPRAVWMLRLCTSVAIIVFSFISYKSTQGYRLCQEITDDMIQVNRKQLSSITPRFQKERILLLHLSNSEIQSLACEKSSSHETLLEIIFRNNFIIFVELLALFILLLSTVLDFIYMDESMISVSLIAMLISMIHTLYHTLRRNALNSLLKFDNEQLFVLADFHLKQMVDLKHYRYQIMQGYASISATMDSMLFSDIEHSLRELNGEGKQSVTFLFHVTLGIYAGLMLFGATRIALKLSSSTPYLNEHEHI